MLCVKTAITSAQRGFLFQGNQYFPMETREDFILSWPMSALHCLKYFNDGKSTKESLECWKSRFFVFFFFFDADDDNF